MAYNPNDLVQLQHLLDLGGRVKNVTDDLDRRIEALVTAGGEPNVLEGVRVNGVALAIANKVVDILIAESDTNGTINVNNVPVAIHGLAAMAYKADVSVSDFSEALLAAFNAKAEGSDLTALQATVDALVGSDPGDANKTAREIASEEVAKIVADAPVAYDTLKEIADWILGDQTGAAKMANDIQALLAKTEVGTHEVSGQTVEYATVKDYVEAVVADFITLAGISAVDNGTGNVVTGVTYNSQTGVFTIQKDTMVAPTVPTAAHNVALLSAAGQLEDAGVGIATNAAVSEALEEIFPTQNPNP